MSASPPPSDRRRAWLISRGLLSPNPGPSRRLAGLLPRVGGGASHASASGSVPYTAAPPAREPAVDLRSTAARQPIVVTRASVDSSRPTRAARTVSLPSADNPPAAPSHAVARAASTRAGDRAGDRAVSPPGRRRFLRRSWRRGRDGGKRAWGGTSRFGAEEPRAPPPQAPAFVAEEPRRARAVYTVVDRDMPRGVLQGDACFEGTTWNEYRERIDELAEDQRFMDYLTAPVQPRHPPNNPGTPHARQLAVNKLYPLAFIRLLEAHAKCDSETSEPCDPAEELHRYDDLERDDEDRLERTQSSGMYDMGRFRTVGGSSGASPSRYRPSQDVAGRRSLDYGTLLDNGPQIDVREHRRRAYHSNFLGRIGRESRSIVPVC